MSDKLKKNTERILAFAGKHRTLEIGITVQHIRALQDEVDRLTAIQAQGGGAGDGWPKTACGVADMVNAGTHTIAKAAHAAPPSPQAKGGVVLPPGTLIQYDFDYDREAQEHIPMIRLLLPRVHRDDTSQKPWDVRDKIVGALHAAITTQEPTK